MSDYVKITNFLSKDSLASGEALKAIKGSEHDAEYNAIAVASATKLDKSGGTLTGALTADNITVPSGKTLTITGALVLTGDQVQVAEGGTGATSAGAARTNLGLGTMSTQAASAVAITGGTATLTGGTITGITDLTVADGGTGASTAAGARANLGAAASGANSDITSITGLTTGLTVAQGGTGASTPSTARGNLGIHCGSVAANGTGTGLSSGWSSVRSSTGAYTITHSLGTANYSVTVQRIDSGGSVGVHAHLATKDINTFTVSTQNSGTPTDDDFEFVFIEH